MKYDSSLSPLPVDRKHINPLFFLEELVNAASSLAVYQEKVKESKFPNTCFLPLFQMKEALASSALEGIHPSLEEVLAAPLNRSSREVAEVIAYCEALSTGLDTLKVRGFSDELFFCMHAALTNPHKKTVSSDSKYRNKENVPPAKKRSIYTRTQCLPFPENVSMLMAHFTHCLNHPDDDYHPLIQAAVSHALFAWIQPFATENGRIGRLLIPLYLFAKKQTSFPSLFLSEIFARDKHRYRTLLHNAVSQAGWNEWIKYFLAATDTQCRKHSKMIADLNDLYTRHLKIFTAEIHSSKAEALLEFLYAHPVINAKEMTEATGIPATSVNRYLRQLTEVQILFADDKQRNRTFFCYDLLEILQK